MTHGWYTEHRRQVESFFTQGHLVTDSDETHVSPSGKYRLLVQDYTTKPGCRDYTRGRVYAGDNLLADVRRNYGTFHFGWAEVGAAGGGGARGLADDTDLNAVDQERGADLPVPVNQERAADEGKLSAFRWRGQVRVERDQRSAVGGRRWNCHERVLGLAQGGDVLERGPAAAWQVEEDVERGAALEVDDVGFCGERVALDQRDPGAGGVEEVVGKERLVWLCGVVARGELLGADHLDVGVGELGDLFGRKREAADGLGEGGQQRWIGSVPLVRITVLGPVEDGPEVALEDRGFHGVADVAIWGGVDEFVERGEKACAGVAGAEEFGLGVEEGVEGVVAELRAVGGDGTVVIVADPRYYEGRGAPEQLCGAIYRALPPQKQAFKPEDWNKYQISCIGPRIKVILNGELVQDYNLDEQTQTLHRDKAEQTAPPLKDRPRKGHIGFQELCRDGGHSEFRNVTLRVFDDDDKPPPAK